MSDTTSTRHAVVKDQADRLETIRRYMPSNYSAEADGNDVRISGTDSAGWTLDGYVIPRLASGLYFAREVFPGAPIAFKCPECEQVWTVKDDANEWAYGHDCEV